MSEFQGLLTGWLTELAAVLPFGFAFGVGMVAAVNPCGFAMLPAYLSLYLGAHEEDFGKRSSKNTPIQTSGCTSYGSTCSPVTAAPAGTSA